MEIAELKQLRNISLFDNQFTGAIPQGLGINSSLTEVNFTRNKFTGPISPNLCFRKQLWKLILGQNHLQGSVPSDIGSMLPEFLKNSNPLFMELSNNSLHGSIPSSLGNLVTVTLVDLSLSKLTYHIPPELGRLVELQELNLSHNRLNRTLPSQLSSCHKLSKLDLSHNLLNGTIPSSLRSLSELSILDLSENRFGGGISASLFQLGKLSCSQVCGNQLGGPIPPSIGSQAEAQSLREFISCNNLSRSLEAIGKLHFSTEVNVSYNAFAGPVPLPTMKWVASSPSSFLAIPIYVANGFKFCNMLSRKAGLTCVGVAMIVSGSILFSVVLVLGIFYVFSRHKCHERNFLVSAEEGASSLLHQVMEASENLNHKYVIGKGSHGTAYKVTLGLSKVFALKKLTFVGYKGGNTRSLHDVLHKTCPSPLLERNGRYKIALGTAQGLLYLHFDCDPAIIHWDIKPMNILLGSEMEPHISDFGITKLLDESVVPATSNVVQGIIGYMASKNAFSTKSSKESDVYAYGVLLSKLVTRKKVLDPSFRGEMDIVAWVSSVWNETKDVEAIVNPTLIDEFMDSSIKEQVKDAILVASRCTEKKAGKRPSMREVVKQLTVSDSRCRSKKCT
ncbi:Serine/threonine protein kinase [Handroanthus impetiginosus]|uniref:Serine/threonine protein kinase n=1 Tax=Handroanthus impetiginosus TaxID=429701 RepID=A0A2G9GQT5_9LAMI|nr:Serine/threonine protein kinase [Handroanthus impetiginosus]